MKKILFPTDFSANADHALKYTAKLCEALKADLILLHACHVPVYASQAEAEAITEEKILKDATVKINALVKQDFLNNKTFRILPVVNFGFAVDTIVSTAKEMKADLIAMGTQGASGLEEVFIGSNTANVMSAAECPVLAIPKSSEFNGLKKIVFATDYRDTDADSIHYLSQIAALFKSQISTIHVYELNSPTDFENELLDRFKKQVLKRVNYPDLSFETIRGYHVAETLNSFIEDNQVDLVALSTKRKTILASLFSKSLTRKMASHTRVPFLSVHK